MLEDVENRAFQVNVYIGKKDEDRIFLSLFPQKENEKDKTFTPNFGGRYSGIVKIVKDDGLDIQLNNTNKRGFIPNAHLSENVSLCQAVKSKGFNFFLWYIASLFCL